MASSVVNFGVIIVTSTLSSFTVFKLIVTLNSLVFAVIPTFAVGLQLNNNVAINKPKIIFFIIFYISYKYRN